jgi:hypothetical protein
MVFSFEAFGFTERHFRVFVRKIVFNSDKISVKMANHKAPSELFLKS